MALLPLALLGGLILLLLRTGPADALKPARIEDIIATANSAGPKLRALVCGVLAQDAAAVHA